jgi:O-antigen ligase
LKNTGGFFNSKIYLIDVLIFLTVLLIGADTLSLNIGGFNFRFVQVIAVLAVLILILQNQYKMPTIQLFIVFCILMFISCLFSVSLAVSFTYFLWVIYDFIFITCLIYSYIRYYSIQRFIDIYRITMFIQVVLIMFQFFLELIGVQISFFNSGTFKGIPRPAIWFYETSYTATHISFWLALSAYMAIICNSKQYFKDLLFAILGIIFGTSSVGFIAIGLVMICIMCILLHKKKYLRFSKMLLLLLLLSVVIYLLFKNIITTFLFRIFNDGIYNSSGGRVEMYKETWNVFINNLFFGVGPGAYGIYLGFDRSYVPSNVTLELLATVGLFATVAFYCFIFFIIYCVYKCSKENKNFSYSMIFALLIFLVILQANQNYLRLYMWMFLGMLVSQMTLSKAKKKNVRIINQNESTYDNRLLSAH